MKFYIFTIIVLVGCGKNVSSGGSHGSNLVTLGYAEVSNLSGDSDIEYLRGSIRDAGLEYLDKIFVYNKTREADLLAASAPYAAVLPSQDDQKKICEATHTDILIHSSFTISGKREKTIHLETTVFRCDEGVVVETIANSAKINNRIFEEIQKIAESIVKAIGAYQQKLSGPNAAKREITAGSEKVVLSKESFKILPFIPPVF